jgi:hypothetical protein
MVPAIKYLTLLGPAYFEQKLQLFQLFKNNLFLSDLSKYEHQKAFRVRYSLKQLGLYSGTTQSGQ